MQNFDLLNGDCIEKMKKIQSSTIDLIITDPPYNLGKFMADRDTNLGKMRDNFFGVAGWDDLDYKEWKKSMNKFFHQAARVIKDGGSMIVFMSIIKVETLINIAQKNGFYYKTTGIWHKSNPMPRNMNLHFVNSTESWVYFTYRARTGTFNNSGKVLHDFIETSVTPQGERKYGKHPTQKPEQLMEHFVTILSDEDDTILDPFMGSGSTGVVAVRNNRKFIGIELDDKYFYIAQSRIQEVCNNE
ncbi:DNA-methyltransferase [Anaerocolumna jejuensis]|uniref:DNA-methyltransferase n=1 Tax=Anaerocolumna jejuensis TaxID=259063 RepID=UPI003F7C6B32